MPGTAAIGHGEFIGCESGTRLRGFLEGLPPSESTGIIQESIHIIYLCPVCKGEASKDPADGDPSVIDCRRCGGIFEIGGSYCHTRDCQNEPLHLLSGVLRGKCERREPVPAAVEEEEEMGGQRVVP